MKQDLKYYLDQIVSGTCICGREKETARAVCWHCNETLPIELLKGLLKPVRGGFEDAFDKTEAWLSQQQEGGLN